MSGVSLKTLKDFIDHEYESQTNKYAYLAVLHLQSEMDLLEAVLNPIATEAQLAKLQARKILFYRTLS